MTHCSPSFGVLAHERSPGSKEYLAGNSLFSFFLQIMTWVKIILTRSLVNNISDMFDTLLCIISNQILISFVTLPVYVTQWLSPRKHSAVAVNDTQDPLIILVSFKFSTVTNCSLDLDIAPPFTSECDQLLSFLIYKMGLQ